MGRCAHISLFFLLFSPILGDKTWQCNKLKPDFQVLKGSAVKISFGHYTASCLRSESQDGVYFVCEKETFCGTGLRSDVLPANVNQSEMRNSLWSPEADCVIYMTKINRNNEGEGKKNCDVIELQLSALWHDHNRCAGVHCSDHSAICVDRFGHFECVNSQGETLERARVKYEWGDWSSTLVTAINTADQLVKHKVRQCYKSDGSETLPADCEGGINASWRVVRTYIKDESALNWPRAKEVCKEVGGRLFDDLSSTPADITEICYDFPYKNFWTLFWSRAKSGDTFLHNITGQPVSGIDWDDNQPGEPQFADRAVMIRCENQKYHDAYTKMFKYGTICIVDAGQEAM